MDVRRRSNGRAPWRTVGLGLLALVVLWNVRATDSGPPESTVIAAPAAPVTPTPAPSPPAPVPPPPATSPVGPLTGEGLADALLADFGVDVSTAGIVRTEGFRWTGIFEDGYDHLSDEGDWMEWTRHFAPRPNTAVEGERFEERARLVVDPTICHDFHRQVTDPYVGFGGDAGARVTAAITEYLGPFPYLHLEDDGWREECEDAAAGGGAMTGYVLDEVVRLPCGRPGAPGIRCFIASRSAYDLTARSDWTARPFIVDRATGGPADVRAHHPGLTSEQVARLFELTVRWTQSEDQRDQYVAGVVIPEPGGLAMWWFDYYDFQVGLDSARVLIPWGVIDEVAAHIAA